MGCDVKTYLQRAFTTIMVLVWGIVLQMSLLSGSADARDLDEVKKSGVLRHLGVPYANFVSGSGDGMDVELLSLFAQHLGLKYEYVRTTWDDAIADLTGNFVRAKGQDIEILGDAPIKGDVIANGMTVLPWREKILEFSTPTFVNQVWLVSRADSPIKPIRPSGNLTKDIAEVKKVLRNQSLLGKANTCLDPSLYDLERTGAKIKLFGGSLNELAPAVINKESDLTLLDVPDALIALQKWPGKIKVIGPVSANQNMAVAFAKDGPKLRDAFNAFLERCRKDGTYMRIVKKYYPFVLSYYPDFFREK